MPFSSSPFLNTFSRIYCIQRKKNCKWKSLMLITFFQYCESISLTLCYYLSLSFALLCGGNEASEKKEREAAVVLVTCIRRQGFQICCVICVLGFGGSKLPVMLNSHHRHICSFSGQLINQQGASTFLQHHLKHCVTSMCKHLECKLTAQFALHTAFWK